MIECTRFRDLIDQRLDGDLAGPQARELDSHLAACGACRELCESLSRVVAGLRELPEHRFPDEALEGVFNRTLRADTVFQQQGGRSAFSRKVFGQAGHRSAFPPRAFAQAGRRSALLRWTPLAAAAAVGIILLLIVPRATAPDRPTPAELAKGEREVRIVLSLTARALGRAQHAASDRVLADEVAPALRRVPIKWRALQPERKS